MAIIHLIGDIVGRKVANKVIEKQEERAKEGLRDKEDFIEPNLPEEKHDQGTPEGSLFQAPWSLDDEKTFGQAIVTVAFFLIITLIMDSVVILPFVDKPEASGILDIVLKFPPSLLVGAVLTVVVSISRRVELWQKILAWVVSVGAGFLAGSFFALVPLLYLLPQPVSAEVTANEGDNEAEAENPAPEPTPAPETNDDPLSAEIDGAVSSAASAAEPVAAKEHEEAQAKAQTNEGSKPATTQPKLSKDAEIPDDYEDPIAQFLKD